jgi:hypothetical protein
MGEYETLVIRHGIEYSFKLHLGSDENGGMWGVLNKHSTFFQTGMFSFLEESFISDSFGEAEDGSAEEQPGQGITEPMEKQVWMATFRLLSKIASLLKNA